MKKIIIYILSIIALASCKKIESNLENTANPDPIYKMQGNINDQPFDYTLNGTSVFMNNGVESMNGVPAFYTEFESIDNSTTIRLSLISPEKIYKEITQYPIGKQDLSFLVHKTGCFNLGFSETPVNPPYIMIQDIGAEQFENKETIEVEEYGVFEIPIRFKGISNDTYTFTVNHGFENPDWHGRFNVSAVQSGINFGSQFLNNSHQWFIDGQAVGQSASGFFAIDTSFNGLHTLSHYMTDNQGNKCEYSQIIYVYSNDIKWVFENTQCSPDPIASNFEHIIISFEENGEEYSSAFSEDNSNTKFTIDNIEYFLENSNSSAISVKFDAAFSGILYNENKSKKLVLSDVIGTFKYTIE